MKPSKHARGEAAEPAGRMVNTHGHWEYRYDDPALNPPAPPARLAPEPAAPSLRVVGESASDPDPAPQLADYQPAQLRPRHDGWTAERQRRFLTVLAETGSISMACARAGVSSRSAYRLRAHSQGAAFADAWDTALRLATARLTTLAYERATRGTVRETWVEGELKTTVRAPSDKLLIFLLQHLLPAGRPGERWTGFEAMATAGRAGFAGQLANLTDQDVEMVPLESRDFFGEAPSDQTEDV